MTLKTLLICMLMLIGVPSFAEVLKEDPDEIELKESGERDKGKSLLIPFQAFTNGTQVTVTALVSVEDVTIALVGENGMMDVRTLSFNAGQSEVFSLEGCANGLYCIALSNSYGMDLYGEFRIGD